MPDEAPRPQCGQVWVDEFGTEGMVLAVGTDFLWRDKHHPKPEFLVKLGGSLDLYHWPPRKSKLIAGPGAPWAPNEEKS